MQHLLTKQVKFAIIRALVGENSWGLILVKFQNTLLISLIVHLILGALFLFLLPPLMMGDRGKQMEDPHLTGSGTRGSYIVQLDPLPSRSTRSSKEDSVDPTEESSSSGISMPSRGQKKRQGSRRGNQPGFLKNLGVPLFSPPPIKIPESIPGLIDPVSGDFGFGRRLFQTIGNAWFAKVIQKLSWYYKRHNPFPPGTIHQVRADIYIDQEGNITQLTLLDSSGVGFVDESVTESLTDQLRIPNPPKYLFKKEKTLKLPFSFSVKY